MLGWWETKTRFKPLFFSSLSFTSPTSLFPSSLGSAVGMRNGGCGQCIKTALCRPSFLAFLLLQWGYSMGWMCFLQDISTFSCIIPPPCCYHNLDMHKSGEFWLILLLGAEGGNRGSIGGRVTILGHFQGVTGCGTQCSCPAGDWLQVGLDGLGSLF